MIRAPLAAAVFVAGLFASAFAAKTPAGLFPDLEGWKKGDVSLYGPDNLYEPIDGAADLFLRYHFEQMSSVEYSRGGDSFTVEVYRHATPTDAFGPYSQGMPDREVYVDIGVQGFAENGSLVFLAGRHYVEMRTASPETGVSASMKEVARRMAASLNGGARFPEIFRLFPEKGRKPHSERYLAIDVLGYAFLKQAFVAEYTSAGASGFLHVLPFSGEREAGDTLAAYLREQGHAPVADNAAAEIADKFQGHLYLQKTGRYLLFLTGRFGPEAAKALLSDISSRLNP